MERSFLSRTESAAQQRASIHDLPPDQVGLAAALRRAFALPAGETERQFHELLQKLC